MNFSFKKNRWQALLMLVSVASLLALYLKSQAVDPVGHNSVVGHISELQRDDIELGEAVLQLNHHLVNNYDGVVALMQRIEMLSAQLAQYHKKGLLPDTPTVRQELLELKQQVAHKSQQLERFKSHNAVMKNALIYLPSMVNDVLKRLPKNEEVLQKKFELLLRDALLVRVKGDETSIGFLEADIERVETILPEMPENVKSKAGYILQHAKTLFQLDKEMPKLLADLSAYQGQHLGVDLGQLYNDYYQQQQRTASLYRLFLLLVAMATLGYAIYVYFRLKLQREQLALALAEVSNQQQALNEHAIVSITDVNGNITYVNEKFIEISGYSADELIGNNHRMVKSGEHSREFFRGMWHSVANGKVWHGQVKNLSKAGHYYWVEATVVPFMDQGGKPYQYVSMRTDITAQKAMEQQVLAERRLLQSVMNTLGEGVYVLDVAGNCTYLNHEAESLLGWTAEEVVGKNLHDRIQPVSDDAEENSVRRCTLMNKMYRSETDFFKHKAGALFPISIVASPMRDGEKVTGMVAAFQNIYERKSAELDLLQAKESAEAASLAKGDFLANMSHEIRTPMNGIIGMTELALDTELSSEQREYLKLVKSSADALLTIINDILDFSKIESGKLDIETIEFSLEQMLRETMKSLAVRAHQKQLELLLHIAVDAPDRLLGDPGRLRQVIVNLVGNAIKFTQAGEIEVAVSCQPKATDGAVRLQFSVRDTGIGIPEEKFHIIFESFSQADTSTTRRYGGTGLGLTISTQLVQLMGGQIGLDSEVGRGSRFYFELDLQMISRKPLADYQQVGEVEGMSVLVVDDNATNRLLLQEMLHNWKMLPTVTSNGEEALAELARAAAAGTPYGFALLDLHMPGMDGFDLAERIRQHPNYALKTMMMLTSEEHRGQVARCRELGVSAYLMKPVAQSELFDGIMDVLGVSAQPDAITTRHALKETRRHLNLLLAEDNAVNQKLATRILEKLGHTVTIANNGIEAVQQWQNASFDAIFMDVDMPQMNGYEATARIRDDEQDSDAHIHIVAMTAHAMQGAREICLSHGMDGYLSKPIDINALWHELDSLAQQLEMTVPVEQSEWRVADFDQARIIMDDDRDLFDEIVNLFLEDAPSQMQKIKEALAKNDVKLMQRSAHTLKGMAGVFAAEHTLRVAELVEKMAGKPEGHHAVMQLDAALSELINAINAYEW
ncbi:MAG: response regulator [Gallionella sp.]